MDRLFRNNFLKESAINSIQREGDYNNLMKRYIANNILNFFIRFTQLIFLMHTV